MKRVSLQWTGDGGQVFFIEVDATTREVHTHENTITDHAVETGSNVSDHIRPSPNRLSMDGIISNAPQFLPKDLIGRVTFDPTSLDVYYPASDNRSTVEGVAPTLSNVVRLPLGLSSLIPIGAAQSAQVGRQLPASGRSVLVSQFSGQFDRITDVYEELLTLRDLGVLLTVDTSLHVYENMGIASFSVQRSGGDSDALRFSLELKQIRFGTVRTEPVPVLPVARTNKGSATPKKDDSAQPVEQESFLHYITK